MDNLQEITKVGVGVMVWKEGKILLGKRKNAHGEGTYAFPGGHVEYLESFHETASRESFEECGISITNIRFQYLANISLYAPKHYVHIGLVADWQSGEPVVMEPDKCDGWDWYTPEELPKPLFYMCELAVHELSAHKSFYDQKDLPTFGLC